MNVLALEGFKWPDVDIMEKLCACLPDFDIYSLEDLYDNPEKILQIDEKKPDYVFLAGTPGYREYKAKIFEFAKSLSHIPDVILYTSDMYVIFRDAVDFMRGKGAKVYILSDEGLVLAEWLSQ